ncbi:hypothetical protein [Streptomyces poriferorum]|uniref:Uncharacterized protein n=1 Tax=Streptomyces poriferorum TaxID=2798799 RepID=A0ABY9IJ91_9ACTN|nr:MULTISPECIES: hypothetical protein [unclassified Streptomyces]MDP5316159.1 hypothetical protein [Streptomyces sp. Alt4]WLQ54494.1 hypothetical protein P8A19_03110 [Streptomyces sp. Alt2]
MPIEVRVVGERRVLLQGGESAGQPPTKQGEYIHIDALFGEGSRCVIEVGRDPYCSAPAPPLGCPGAPGGGGGHQQGLADELVIVHAEDNWLSRQLSPSAART